MITKQDVKKRMARIWKKEDDGWEAWLNLGQPKTYEEWVTRESEATPCPVCGVESVNAKRFAMRIWAGCGHFEVIEKAANEAISPK